MVLFKFSSSLCVSFNNLCLSSNLLISFQLSDVEAHSHWSALVLSLFKAPVKRASLSLLIICVFFLFTSVSLTRSLSVVLMSSEPSFGVCWFFFFLLISVVYYFLLLCFCFILLFVASWRGSLNIDCRHFF